MPSLEIKPTHKVVVAYRLGDRNALEWVIDQYRVTKDDNGNTNNLNTRSTPQPNPLPVRGGEGTDPNRLDDEQYIVRLIGQVIGQVIPVSLETVKVANELLPLKFE